MDSKERKELYRKRLNLPLPDGKDWVGKRVMRVSSKTGRNEEGIVLRMATGKSIAMFVQFQGEAGPRYCYASELKLID